ncbi:uncharacterized protein LOC115238180 [Formica exsecta]|uniref:uncharacterized protein LOC115238180 n=1 Tax=Formica exsecta TaxID=72781 RepID=UPI001141B8BC|nr:uncharacterized protein LOC115238180 [Formica exsecta]
MDQIRHKCGYCGWIFRFTTNFIDHDCFKHYIEGVDHISVDENYVVTIAVRSKRGLYDFRVPASERTMLRKNALWVEVSNILGGSLSSEEAKARWKYLRDNYIKARKKVRAYVPSGSAGTAANVITENKSRFQYYELMRFLNDSLQTRPTVSSLTDSSAKSEVDTSLDTGNEQHEGNTLAKPSTTLQISAINNSPQTPAFSYIPSRTSTPTNISSQTLDSIDVLSRTPSPTTDFSWKSTQRRVPTRTRATGSKRLFIYIFIC